MPASGVDVGTAAPAITILVVEDEPLIRLVIAEALRDLGVCVVEASSAEEAWEYLATGAQVDLVFTDNRTPGQLTGVQLARRIRQQYPTLLVMVTSAVLDSRECPEPVLGKPYATLATAARLVELARARRLGS